MGNEYEYTPMTALEKMMVACGILAGVVFTSAHLHKAGMSEQIPVTFMPLVLTDDDEHLEFLLENHGMLYEWRHKTATNHPDTGLPIFATMEWCDKADYNDILLLTSTIVDACGIDIAAELGIGDSDG